MKTVVCVKQVQSFPGRVQLNESGPDPAFLDRDLNDADTYAVEAALELRDAEDGEVVVLTFGDEGSESALRTCLGMGADRAIRLESSEISTYDTVGVARALAEVLTEESADLVLMGVQASDAPQQSMGPAVAAALGLPCISVVTGIQLEGDGVTLVRELEGGMQQTVRSPLPSLLTVQTGANEPRYGNFKQKMVAKKAAIDVRSVAGPVATLAVRSYAPAVSSGSSAAMIDGGPDVVARELVSLIREAQS